MAKNGSGSVLVVGGGIDGIQASLDLANSGFRVFLVESTPTLGGMMAQLDKTFPTNDCSMCIMSPKLVDCARHLNITLLTLTDVQSVRGEPGDFTVTVRRKARYVDESRCTGCGECTRNCPVTIPNPFDEGLSERKAIYRPFPQAAPNVFAIEKTGTPPCRAECPAGCNGQGYTALIRERKFKEALDLIRDRVPLPLVCGRICGHLCEAACNRHYIDESVQLRALKRFAADYEMKMVRREGWTALPSEAAAAGTGERVAIIGSGPAGLTAAWDLAKHGLRPVVFEALPVAGGMLRVGIPRYRLPAEILDYEIDLIRRAGVEIRTGTPVGPDLTMSDLLQQGFKAVFIAIGTHRGRRLGVEGEDLEGVHPALGFLKGASFGSLPFSVSGRTVAVIGGGHTAIDAARTALRFGARHSMVVYRRTRDEMPVSEQELAAAEAEGVKIHYLVAPRKIVGRDGRVASVLLTRMRLGAPDATGRREPMPVDGETRVLDADLVIPAIGQVPELTTLAEKLGEFRVTRDGIVPLAGVEMEGVRGFQEFLQDAASGRARADRNVLVIGGGNAAVDAARAAKRLGAEKVRIICLESRSELPADGENAKAAESEGVVFYHRRAPKRIVGRQGRLLGVETLECESVFDRYGRYFPRIREGSESFVEGDAVLVATGQGADTTLLDVADGAMITERGLLKVDPVTLQTNVPGIFAGGDAAGAGGLAVHSIAQGHQAAESIERYLRGEDLRAGRTAPAAFVAPVPLRAFAKVPPVEMGRLPLAERVGGFEEVERGFTEEEAVAEASRCLDCGTCSDCRQCVDACKAQAVDHSMTDRMEELHIGAVLLSPGCDRVDLGRLSRLGYGTCRDVVTSLQFERILSASGPFGGHIRRPSDGATPKKIAFVQCAGSRDPVDGNEHCSSICCMYSIKEAVIAREHEHEIQPVIFYIDIRAHGKDFDRYYERAREEYGVRFTRAKVARIRESGGPGLQVEYEKDGGGVAHEQFDMAVLAVGFSGGGRLRELGSIAGVPLNRFGFIASDPFSPIETKVPGIFICGPAQEPKDIPETVMQASAGAAAAAEILSENRWTEVREKSYPPEKKVEKLAPRVGAFVCHCGTNIGGTVRVAEVVEYARGLPGVVYAEDNIYTCSQDTQAHIRDMVREHDLNRVVVASCTPRTHEPLFQETIREAGLNRHLFEMANIRDQCSWIHMRQPDEATRKARDLVRMAVAKVCLVEPLPTIPLDVVQGALVVGGGPAGMSAALSLARQGFAVDLVEKEARLGGNLNRLRTTIERRETRLLLERMVREVQSLPGISVHLGSRIESVEGFVGQYTTKISANGSGRREIRHGVAVICTGARESQPQGYLYGQDERVMTGLQFERLVHGSAAEDLPDRVVFIQCVGSREKEHPYCSRVCCQQTVKNALLLKGRNPRAEVCVAFRDMRTYGFFEHYYRSAREAGVTFLRYEQDDPPQVSREGGDRSRLTVTVSDAQCSQRLTIPADAVVLAARVDAEVDNHAISQLFKVPLNPDGFFLEAHVKLRPVDFATEGIYLAGMAHNPKTVGEAIVQGRAAAARAATIISRSTYLAEATIAAVNEDLCDGCGICAGVCEYNALQLVDAADGKKKVKLSEAACKGCGCCVAACPSGAMEQKGFKSGQIMAEIDAALVGSGEVTRT